MYSCAVSRYNSSYIFSYFMCDPCLQLSLGIHGEMVSKYHVLITNLDTLKSCIRMNGI